ncbi:hypothetical protein MNBD_ALPHA06-2320 [hydrothermal vent metagenome]|uniref:Uncharacterized protein n=1 Tax=hydrothermal vent metagenome TaxID=652676 RepID=A0A3B0S6S3_9ZZZZ
MKSIIRAIYIAFFIGAVLAGQPAIGAEDCASKKAFGIQLAAQTQNAADDFDVKSKIYNEKIGLADQAAKANNDVGASWPAVLAARDDLVLAGEMAKIKLSAMNKFNLDFLKLGCFQANAEDIQKEFERIIAPVDTSLRTLSGVPDDWKQRYQKPIAKQNTICAALDKQVKIDDANGRAWSVAHDDLIGDYNKTRQKLAALAPTQPAYGTLRQELLRTRDIALPGVVGYPAILGALYQTTLAKQDAGCITMPPQSLQNYQNRHQELLTEIEQQHQDMLHAEDTFPAPKAATIIGLRADSGPAPTVQPTPDVQEPSHAKIRIRNNSGFILCVFNPDTDETDCGLMPGNQRQLDSAKIVVFGGGYWSQTDGYTDMKICRILTPAPNQQNITGGMEAGCSAPSP